ncbi:hypothetical protein ABMA27_010062 [Loxostege sticticalis]|uniref:TIMELESS-interacting protein n=1 Tax=Loxostege sticticalis TaxID=481309 RepID=A0ABR3H7F4_LOXSC
MSLLEDVFLEDEAGEAQELERVIVGDEYDEQPLYPNSDDNEEKDDEAEEDKRRVDPTQAKTKRVIKNPRFLLNPARLTGPRGIQVIPDHFKDFKFKGKGHEKEDLDMVLKKLEHWAYRLYPKFGFHDCLKKIEMLGKKRAVMIHLQKIRSDQFMSEEAVVQRDSSDDEAEGPVQEEDEFDKLLQQQIELARATPTPGSVKKAFSTPSVDRSLMMPKATSSPSISDEQRERMLRNRRLAEERRLAKLRNDNSVAEIDNNVKQHTTTNPEVTESVINEVVARKHNRSNVISSDEDEPIVNKSIAVDVHGKDDDEINDVQFNAKNETANLNNFEGIAEPDKPKEVTNEDVARKRSKFNVIDSSDEDEPVNRVMIVDDEIVDELNDKNANSSDVARKNRSNVIDSSDDDEPTVNRSFTVDVQDKDDESHVAIKDTNQGNDATKNEIINTENSSDSITENRKENTNTIQNSDEYDILDIENIQKPSEIMSNDNSSDLRVCASTLTEDKNEHVELSETNESSQVESQNVNKSTESNKEDVDIDEVMDVDFSDDF